MKKGILFLLLLTAVAASAQEKKQSLKDLLYGGKLKMDSNSVIRKGDDLSAKIDTTTKKPVETPKPQATTTTTAATTVAVSNNEPKQVEKTTDVAKDDAANTVVVPAENNATATTAPVKSNSKILKEYTTTLIAGLTSEVLPSKKIKKETYFVTVDYEIGTEGQFVVSGVTSEPENEFLQGQVRDRIESAPPQLSPVTGSDGKAKKQKKRHSFSITKE